MSNPQRAACRLLTNFLLWLSLQLSFSFKNRSESYTSGTFMQMLLISISSSCYDSFPTESIAMQKAMSSCQKTGERTVSALRNSVDNVSDGLRTQRQQYSKSALKNLPTFCPITVKLVCSGKMSLPCAGYRLSICAIYFSFFFSQRQWFSINLSLTTQERRLGRTRTDLNSLKMRSMCCFVRGVLREASLAQKLRRQSMLDDISQAYNMLESGFSLGRQTHSSTSLWQLAKKLRRAYVFQEAVISAMD